MKNFFTKLTTTLGACSMLVFAGCNDDSFSNPFEDPNAIELDLIAENMTSPVYLTQPPADDQRLFVVDQIGLIRIIKDGSLMEAPFLVIKSKLSLWHPGR